MSTLNFDIRMLWKTCFKVVNFFWNRKDHGALPPFPDYPSYCGNKYISRVTPYDSYPYGISFVGMESKSVRLALQSNTTRMGRNN